MSIPMPHTLRLALLGGILWGGNAFSPVLSAVTAVDVQPPSPLGDSPPPRVSLTLEELDERLRRPADRDQRVSELLAAIDAGGLPETIGELLRGEPLPVGLRSDIALRVAAEHCAARQYEQCLAWLDLVEVELSSSPELYWHYSAVARHQLVQMPQAGEAAQRLLAQPRTGNRRAREIAELIKRDADAYKQGSLEHIAHQMGDVRRRLTLGHAGDANQTLQQEVIDSLDKMIEEIEEQRKQQQQQQQQQMAQGSRGGAAQPMPDSRPAEMKGAGEVEDRDFPPGGDWGSLPPAERERVAQQIIRDFPSHYREVIEDYFRSLATMPAAAPSEQEGER